MVNSWCTVRETLSDTSNGSALWTKCAVNMATVILKSVVASTLHIWLEAVGYAAACSYREASNRSDYSWHTQDSNGSDYSWHTQANNGSDYSWHTQANNVSDWISADTHRPITCQIRLQLTHTGLRQAKSYSAERHSFTSNGPDMAGKRTAHASINDVFRHAVLA